MGSRFLRQALLIGAALTAFACKGYKQIPEETLVDIFTDMYELNAYIDRHPVRENRDSIDLYEPVLAAYGYTTEDFTRTLTEATRRKSFRLTDIIDASVAKMEQERDAIDRELRIVERIDSTALAYSTRELYRDSLITIRSLADSAAMRVEVPLDELSGRIGIDYYYTLVSLDEQLAIYEETERNWKSSVETIKAMKEGGMADEAAVSQSEANYYMVVASIPDIKASIIQQENALCVLLGNTPGVIRRGTLSQQKMEIPVEAGIPLQLLANRPDVRSAEYQLAGMYYSTNQARASFYPQISIGGSAGWTNSVGSVIVNPGKLLLSALASITQPLFYRGSNMAKLKIAKAQEEQARLNFQQTLLNAGQEVSDALVIYEAAEKKRDAREKQIDALYRSVESTTELMRLGSSTYLEVLTAQQSLLSAQITATQDRLSQLQAVVSLYHALGGGRDTTPENDSSQYKNK